MKVKIDALMKLAFVFALITLIGCDQMPKQAQVKDVNPEKQGVAELVLPKEANPQDKLCAVQSGDDAKASCKEGQILLFRPARWGNEQLPITVSSVFCDFNHPIVWNNGGVSCVFTSRRLSAW